MCNKGVRGIRSAAVHPGLNPADPKEHLAVTAMSPSPPRPESSFKKRAGGQ